MTLNEKVVAFNTIVMREIRKTFRLWIQTILPSAITTTLYFLIFGHLMGKRIGTMANLPYINFIVPGLIMMTMLTASFNAAVSTVFQAKFQRSIEEILISPMSSNVSANLTTVFHNLKKTLSYYFLIMLGGCNAREN